MLKLSGTLTVVQVVAMGAMSRGWVKADVIAERVAEFFPHIEARNRLRFVLRQPIANGWVEKRKSPLLQGGCVNEYRLTKLGESAYETASCAIG